MQPGVESTVEPFLVLEPEPAARLESVPLASPPVAPARGRGSTALFGVVLLLVGMPALWAVWLVSALFDRGAAFGWSGVALLLAGFGLIAVGIAREMRALWRVRRVDRLRAGLASGDTARVAAAARGWLAILPQHAAILPAVSAANSPGAILALLRAGPGLALREATDAHGRAAAFRRSRWSRQPRRRRSMRSASDGAAFAWCGRSPRCTGSVPVRSAHSACCARPRSPPPPSPPPRWR